MAPKVGDKVGYAKSFLKSIHVQATDPLWRIRGTVVRIRELGGSCTLAYVQGFPSDNEDGLAHVLLKNLAVVGSLRFCENVTAEGKENKIR